MLGLGLSLKIGFVGRAAEPASTSLFPPLLANEAAFGDFTIGRGSVTLAAPVLENGAQPIPPVFGIGPLRVPALANADALFAPIVGRGPIALGPPLLGDGDELPTPVVGRGPITLLLPLAADGDIFYPPTVQTGPAFLGVPLLASGSALYTPTVATGAATLYPARVESAALAIAPEVGRGAVQLAPPLLANGNTLYGASITPVSPPVAPPRLVNGSALYAPAVQAGPVTLAMPALTDPDSVYAPTVTRGAVTASPPLLSDADTFYVPTVGRGAVTLAAPVLANAGALYMPTVTRGARTLTAPQLANTTALYPPAFSYPIGVENADWDDAKTVWDYQTSGLVGPAPGTVFKVPGVDALPAGMILSAPNHPTTPGRIKISASGVVLDGWDFRNHYITIDGGSNNGLITNSLFNSARNTGHVSIGTNGTQGARNWEVCYCLFDGEGIDANGAAAAVGVQSNNSGGLYFHHNIVKNMQEDNVYCGGNTGNDADVPENIICYNLLFAGGYSDPDAHSDNVTIAGGRARVYRNMMVMRYVDIPGFKNYGLNNWLRVHSTTGLTVRSCEAYENIVIGHGQDVPEATALPTHSGGSVNDISYYRNLIEPRSDGAWHYDPMVGIIRSDGNVNVNTGVPFTEMPITGLAANRAALLGRDGQMLGGKDRNYTAGRT